MLVHQLIFQGPVQKMALRGRRQDVTYGQLQAKVEKYRNYLYQQGVRAGDPVGLFAKNSPEFIYCYMAITSLGAVAVPINFQLVPREIAYIVQDTKMKHLITMSHLELQAELKNYQYDQEVIQLIIPEFETELAYTEYPAVPVIAVDPEDNCVIIYTSGTTGHPKGAVLTHKNLISNVKALLEVLPVTADDKVLCVLPMYHCFAWTCAVLASLTKGASVRIMESFVLKESLAAIVEERLTVVYGVPPMYNLFLTYGPADGFRHVKIFVSGGASLPESVAQQFGKKFGREIVEGYGLSEASPVVALNPVVKVKYRSVGKPLPGVIVRIIGENDNEVPQGIVGELTVQGSNVMTGYYNLPSATEQALRGGWLHTGDLAYRDHEGYLYIVDRLKDIIISSGENIYPREIEELLFTYPDINEAAVVGFPDRLRGQAACAYIVAEEGQTIEIKAVKEFLYKKMASYKIPREFVQIAALPKNATGKVQKTVLRERAAAEFGSLVQGE
jgi:long-chain acyl-CoA synthetase